MVISICSCKVLDDEIVDAETKFRGTSVILPKAGCIRARMVSVGNKLVDEVLVCEDCSLFESLHAKETVEIVLLVKVSGKYLYLTRMNSGFFIGEARKSSLRSAVRKRAVDDELGFQERGCRRSSIIGILEFISTYS
jgi:hypothetical protein